VSGYLYGRKSCCIVAPAVCRAEWPGQASYVLIPGVKTDDVTTDEHGWKGTSVIVRVKGTSAPRGATRPTEAPRDWSVRMHKSAGKQARIFTQISADAR